MNKKEILMQPNSLIKSKYDFTSIENKLFYKILFNAQKQKESSRLYSTKVTKNELMEFMKNKNDYETKNIKEVLNMFQQSVLEFDYIDENTGKLMTFGSGLITSYTLDHEEQTYFVEIHETLYKHITDFIKMQSMGNGYTAINLAVLFNFRGTYTQRLYTLLRLWSRENKSVDVKYTLDELRNYLKLKSSVYPEYKYFKQNVLKRAIKEINEKGNMSVEIKEEIRKNRKVESIVFLVIDYEPRKYFDKKKNIDKLKEIETTATMEIVNFYIPNQKLFTAKTINTFKNDFSCYDFKDNTYKKLLQESILITLEQDNEEKIKAKAYNFFKKTLTNKLSKTNSTSNKAIPTVKTRFHNINQTFNKYSPDELEKILQESQKDKFK